MAAYKTADLFIQVLLIIVMVFIFLLGEDEGGSGFTFLVIFAVVQAISIILHLLAGKQPWKSPLRRIHHIGTLIILLALVIAFLMPSFNDDEYAGLGILIIVSIPAALLALFYTVISFLEWKKIQKPR